MSKASATTQAATALMSKDLIQAQSDLGVISRQAGRKRITPKSASRSVGGVNLAFDDRGSGDPVLFIAGRVGAGRTRHIHQVPAFLAAGYRTITFDNRGIGATDQADGFGVGQMVADTAALIEKLDAAPARIVAVSMGSSIAQELMLARPEFARSAVLLATRGRHHRIRDSSAPRNAKSPDAGIQLPPAFDAKIRLLEELFAEDTQR